ncbi:sigma-54-dependent Fis family transcriptional regulator [Altericroceibacterium spongiae]|uniref:Sigma-54-dependent Fis family transcriptional regulator n=1 Tax=Altericroceibacterium spongiae TaxID=2320269 RepID=A0A420ECB7_9SPHN|nr:sigma-54 dependent transcriptional regulator [Altericroceibacterium spongiae]RKF18304.1 sigma-54-dependent Fis family transcriptional regulator [Altericroceibacterium spongiae]
MSAARVLIVEDTASLALGYAAQLEAANYAIEIAGTLAEAQKFLSTEPFDSVLLDLQLPDGDGLDLLESWKGRLTETSFIVVTADGSLSRAIGAMRLGAYDFLVKPVAGERLLTTVRNAAERGQLTREIKQVRKSVRRDQFQGFIGRSPLMQAVYRQIENVADSSATVFITGESGTGKEVAAEAIHRAGRRSSGPFVAVNCGAIPENLLESELFGHVKGAFTGAVEHRAGAAKEANGGTLFLDEICEMELKLQVKLLRFLQTGMVQKVGASHPEPVDVRIVCATNRNPAREVAEGRFREDLFYRLNVIPLELPALRDRGEDVELIARAFMGRFASDEQREFTDLSPASLVWLHQHDWPGNVRELQNAVRRAVVTGHEPLLELQKTERPIIQREPAVASVDQREVGMPAVSPDQMPVSSRSTTSLADLIRGRSLADLERMIIEAAIDEMGGNVTEAAQALGINPSTIYRKQQKWVGS